MKQITKHKLLILTIAIVFLVSSINTPKLILFANSENVTTNKVAYNVTKDSVTLNLPLAGIARVLDKTSNIQAEVEEVKVELEAKTPPPTTMQEYIETEPILSEYELAELNNNDIYSGTGYYIILGRNIDRFTEEEFDLFCRIIMAETEGEIDEAQQAVGETILNRIDSPYFPNTLYEVIYAPKQFSPVKDGRINLTPSERVIKNAKICLLKRDHPSNMLFFTSCGFFKSYQRYQKIDDMCFSLYKDPIY